MYKSINCVNNCCMEEQKNMENEIKLDKRGEKFTNFMKKYGYYFIAAALILAITLTVVLTSLKGKTKLDVENKDPIEPVNAYALTFDLPLEDCSVLTAHVTDKFVYNETLGWFATHHGVDLTSKKLDVLASAEGTVTKVYTNDLEGTVVIIKHNDVYTAKYGSLDTNVLVKEGDTVKRGQKIGEISSTAKNETKSGKHLHFQLFRDEGEVNPADYLKLETK